MKVVILAGGFGTRLAEETHQLPKPMIKIGEDPIISHIIKHFRKFNFDKVVICAGYKKDSIEKYFLNEQNIQVVDTGLNTQTAARIKKIKEFINDDENFFMTYGDGLSNVNINELLSFHKKNNKIATLTAVRPIPRFGHITLKDDKVIKFKEKDFLSEGWINGGFFVLNKKVFNYINDKEDCIFEREPLENLSKDGELMAFKHEGFWHPIDTLRDKNFLNDLFKKGNAPWV
jgi:glucose-1-phosphate cytidylyltransferase|tara:strand:- start:3472 stop:4164 length:693 start_codon:yes stop_codon:yes gene_type:complete